MEHKKGEEYRIAVTGTGYVGLSLAVLLAQKNTVTDGRKAYETVIETVVEETVGRKEKPIL